jgi:hypothetical protein
MAPVLEDFHSEEVYQKKLTEGDMKESSRLYIMKSAARRICPQAFEQTNYKKDDLPFCDAGLKFWPMVFQKRGDKCYLTGGWGDFVSEKKLSEGDIITIHELKHKRGTEESFFMIGRRMKVREVQIG